MKFCRVFTVAFFDVRLRQSRSRGGLSSAASMRSGVSVSVGRAPWTWMAMMAGDILEKSLQWFEMAYTIWNIRLEWNQNYGCMFFLIIKCVCFLVFFWGGLGGGVPKLTGVGVYPSNSMKREWMEMVDHVFPHAKCGSEPIQIPISG